MGIKTVDFYEVSVDFSEDGRGGYETVGRFWEEPVAKAFAKGRAPLKRDARVTPIHLVIADGIDDMDGYREEEKIQKALAKLNDEDKRVLGLVFLEADQPEKSETRPAIEPLEFYEVSDVFTEDGRGPQTVIGRFWDSKVADEYAQDRGNYRTDAKVKKVNLHIANSIEDMEEYKTEEIRQKALAKLSTEEKRALNLD